MDLQGLNPAQIEAVNHTDGPCCVLAGAGSGKTRVLTQRIGRLVTGEAIPARNILAVTFTRKAAGEMAERLEPIIGASALEALNVGTFHSICYRILRDEWRAQGTEPYEPAGDWWQKRTIRDILAPPGKQNPDGMNWQLDVSTALGFIGWQKNNLITPKDELAQVPEDTKEKYRDLYRAYEAHKERERKLDFDDMLLWCYQLLKENRGVRAKYATMFRYILVDEFQDTNLAQYEILKLWAHPINNVFVVGDDYQAIYGWRAARVDFIIRFEQQWPGAKVVRLETNYRSSSNIVEYSNVLIKHNRNQVDKTCRANREAIQDPIMLRGDDEDEEAAQVVEEIQALVNGGDRKYGDCSVLYRVNAQSRALEDAFIHAGIPYVIHGAAGFYQRKEVRDIIAYLRILENPNDAEAIGRVLNRPTRYLGKVFLQRAQEFASRLGISLLESLRVCPDAGQYRYRGVRDFTRCIDKLYRLKGERLPAQMVMEVRKITQYDAWLAEEEGESDGADNPRIENLNALASAAQRFNELHEFLFYAEQVGSRPTDPETGADKVQLMTLHRAKGLEFPVVFLAGMNQGILPHHRSVLYRDGKVVPESVEEERRLCYVGMTRAEERLYLSTTESYQGKPAGPSMFLAEIWPQQQDGTDLALASSF